MTRADLAGFIGAWILFELVDLLYKEVRRGPPV